MAFAAFGDANIPFLPSGVGSRAVYNGPSSPIIHARNDSTTNGNTVNMFIDGLYDDMEYAASVVTACADKTVYAMQCTSAPSRRLLGSETCGPNAVKITLTANPTTYIVSTAVSTNTRGVAVTGAMEENCVVATSAVTCGATIKGTAQGQSTALSTTTTLSGTDVYRFDVSITGGAEKLANPTGTCAAAGQSAGAMVNPKSIVLWVVAGFMGVGGLLAM